jgi:hypothetical protein
MPTELHIEFAKIIIIENDVAEIIVDKEIELTIEMVRHLHQTLRNNLATSFFLLINKINDYSYDFEAMHELGTIKEIAGIAIIGYSVQAQINSQYMSKLKRKKTWNAKTFNNRDDALEWIQQQK